MNPSTHFHNLVAYINYYYVQYTYSMQMNVFVLVYVHICMCIQTYFSQYKYVHT